MNRIVHLGLGAFARAHLVPATQAANDARPAEPWRITGVSLRSPAVRDALRPQGGRYTLALRDADADGAPRERLQALDLIDDVWVAADEPERVQAAIADPDTRIVSLTVTEKGYHHDPATRRLREADPDLAHDLAGSGTPRTTLGVLARGLQQRRARGLGGVTLLSCDNLPANGDTLRGLLLAFAQRLEPALHDWIAAGCSVPNAMVDRIVPRTTDADRARIAAAIGWPDAAPVVAEPFFDWVIEDRFVAGRPDWRAYGARFVETAAPFEQAKLRMLNGAHSVIACAGQLAGWATVDAAIAQPALRRFVETLWREEVAPTLAPGFDATAYGTRLLERFANPALAHRTAQIAMDGSQKIPQRWLGTVRDRLRAGGTVERLGLAVALWGRFLEGDDVHGRALPLDDPQADALRPLALRAKAAADDAAAARLLCAHAPVFGDLAGEPRFEAAVARGRHALRTAGIVGALAAASA